MKLFNTSRNTDARRRRFGRLPLPSADAVATRPPHALDSVDAFVDRLCELPLADWLVIGYAAIADRAGAPARMVAFSRLESAIASLGRQIAAWHVRDAIDTAAFTAVGAASSWTRANRRAFAAAHAAAEDCALALLAGDALAPAYRQSLIAPFIALDSSPARDRSLAPSV